MKVLSRLARLALAVVLLSAWQAALQHPIEHVDELGAFVHLHDGHDDSDSSSASCDTLAALTACAPDATSALVASEQYEHSLPSHHEGAPRVAQPPPFLSQGPPASV